MVFFPLSMKDFLNYCNFLGSKCICAVVCKVSGCGVCEHIISHPFNPKIKKTVIHTSKVHTIDYIFVTCEGYKIFRKSLKLKFLNLIK